MNASSNLAPERSRPSVWEPQPPAMSLWRAAAFVAGTMLIARATRRRGRWWALGVGLSSLGFGLLRRSLSGQLEQWRIRARARRSVEARDPLDDVLEQTFPASDPPAIP